MPPHPASVEHDYDLLIQNGTVVSVFTGETFPADVAINGETIAAVLAPGSIKPGQAAEGRNRCRLLAEHLPRLKGSSVMTVSKVHATTGAPIPPE